MGEGTHYAGTDCCDAASHNDLTRDGGELHTSVTNSDVIAEYNYWGSSNGPNFNFVWAADGGAFDGTPYLNQSGEGCSGGPILGRSAGSPERPTEEESSSEEASGPPEGMDPLRWHALRSAHEGNRPAAFGHLVRAIETARTERDKERAYAVLAQLASRGATPPSVKAFLTTRARVESDRPWALGALATLRTAQGRMTDAVSEGTALTEEYAGTEHALRGWLARHAQALEAGDAERAGVALTALEAGWPEHEATALAREEHALYYGEEPAVAGRGTSGADPTASVRAGTASAGASVELSAFALGAAYPNPTQNAATVPLALAERAAVRVMVYDVLGRPVVTLADAAFEAGLHALPLDASALAAGLYVVRAEVRTGAGTMRTLHRRITVTR